jgi:uncharacterized membrane protein YidH (DUF202 family)
MPSRPLEQPQPTIGPAPEIPPPYERKFGMIRRLYGALLKPNETMKDIALSPDYWGVIVILILEVSLVIVDFSLVLSKFHFEGQYASQVSSMVSIFVGTAVAITIVLFPLRWLVKSVIVWKACDSGSMWSFKIAASVTGYAYVADLVIGIISSLFLPFFIPELTINTTDLDVARKLIDEYMLKITSLKLYMLPISFGTILWKSYLGGIGTHYGTKQMCAKALGTLVFLLLSLVGLLINYLTT